MNALYRWYHDLMYNPEPGGFSRVIKTALKGLTPVYDLVRRFDQRGRRKRRKKLPLPVISVGNITVGGSGKTGFVSRLAQELVNRGERVGILKRGEGKEAGPARVRGRDPEEMARRFGDEAALLQERHPEVSVVVGSERFEAGELLRSEELTVFLLDDGFQHQQLVRDLDIVLVGDLKDLENDLLPAGPLREPVSGLNRADVISLPLDAGSNLQALPRLSEDVLMLRHGYRFISITQGKKDVTRSLRKSGVRPLLTLAKPDRVLTMLGREKIPVNDPILLPDHGSVPPSVQQEIVPEETLVTGKEWIKLPANLRKRVNRLNSRMEIEHLDELVERIRRVGVDR